MSLWRIETLILKPINASMSHVVISTFLLLSSVETARIKPLSGFFCRFWPFLRFMLVVCVAFLSMLFGGECLVPFPCFCLSSDEAPRSRQRFRLVRLGKYFWVSSIIRTSDDVTVGGGRSLSEGVVVCCQDREHIPSVSVSGVCGWDGRTIWPTRIVRGVQIK